MNKTTFIYALCEPGTKTIRYFGKANSPKDRHTDHIREARNGRRTHLACWIRKLLKIGQRPDVHVLCEVPQDDFARFERAFISLGRNFGFDLTNFTEGGENPPAMHGPAHPNFGKKLPADHIEKIRASRLGKRASLETRAKLSEAGRGRKHTLETRRKIGRRGVLHHMFGRPKELNPNFGRVASEATKNKLRVPKSDETRLKFRTKKSTNTSGFVGVSKNSRLGKWQSAFCDRGKSFYIGMFSKIEDAVFARALAIANL